MNFTLEEITACVKHIAARLLPGWDIRVSLAKSIEEIGALAYVQAVPKRSMAFVTVAPHPVDEDLKESIAHELTHAVISPLVELIEYSPAAVIIEEQIVERLGKFIASATPEMMRGVASALGNPRTNSTVLRKRISALAIGRRNDTRKRMDPKQLAALAMEGGALTASDNPDPEAMKAWITKAVEIMASGGVTDAEPASGPARTGAPEDKNVPPMREDQVPPALRVVFRNAAAAEKSARGSAVRMRLTELSSTVDIPPHVKVQLEAAASIEDFESKLSFFLAGATGETRKRSGVVPREDKGAEAEKLSDDELGKRGLDPAAIKYYRGLDPAGQAEFLKLRNAPTARKRPYPKRGEQ